MLHVEPGEVVSGPGCTCCAKPGRSAFGFVHRDGEPVAFYHAWLDPHRDRTVVVLAISLGDWSHSGDVLSRQASAIRLEAAAGEVSATFVEPAASPFADREALGTLLSADAARRSVLLGEFLSVAEAIALDDPEVNSHLTS
jgi:hypothetical protein